MSGGGGSNVCRLRLDARPAELRVDDAQDFLVLGKLALAIGHEAVPDTTVAVDQEQRGPCNVPGREAHAVPDTVGLNHFPRPIDEDIEGKACLFDVPLDPWCLLAQDDDDLDPAAGVFREVVSQFPELAFAVRSPGSAVKHEEHGTTAQKLGQGPLVPALRGEPEQRRRGSGR